MVVLDDGRDGKLFLWDYQLVIQSRKFLPRCDPPQLQFPDPVLNVVSHADVLHPRLLLLFIKVRLEIGQLLLLAQHLLQLLLGLAHYVHGGYLLEPGYGAQFVVQGLLYFNLAHLQVDVLYIVPQPKERILVLQVLLLQTICDQLFAHVALLKRIEY